MRLLVRECHVTRQALAKLRRDPDPGLPAALLCLADARLRQHFREAPALPRDGAGPAPADGEAMSRRSFPTDNLAGTWGAKPLQG